jgi:hypothetical protein
MEIAQAYRVHFLPNIPDEADVPYFRDGVRGQQKQAAREQGYDLDAFHVSSPMVNTISVVPGMGQNFTKNVPIDNGKFENFLRVALNY